MRTSAIDVLACPTCLGALSSDTSGNRDIESGTLRCARDAAVYPIVNGIPRLVRTDRVPQLERLASSYSAAWAKDGWGSANPRYFLNLPFRDITRRRSVEWRLKARSLSALLELLESVQSKVIIDLGAGVGWLSYHLARLGANVFAADMVVDNLLGLGAASHYLETGVFFERIWADLERPPFRERSADIVICNASLHYARDLQGTVSEASRILAPGGLFIVMNSPVYRDPTSAARAEAYFRKRLRSLGASVEVVSGYHHLIRSVLESVIRDTVGPPGEIPFRKGFLFQSKRLVKATLLRTELASFPSYCARKNA